MRLALATAGALLGMAGSAQAAGTLSGQVNGPTGAPVSSAVCVYAVDATGQFVAQSGSSESGAYALSVPAGTWRVRFEDDQGCLNLRGRLAPQYLGGTAVLDDAQVVTVADGQTVGGLDVKLPLGGQLAGKVTEAGTNVDLSGVCVVVTDAAGRIVQRTTTNRSGTYDLDQFPPGDLRVRFVDDGCGGGVERHAPRWFRNGADLASAEAVAVLAGERTEGIDVSLVAVTPPPAAGGGGPVPPGSGSTPSGTNGVPGTTSGTGAAGEPTAAPSLRPSVISRPPLQFASGTARPVRLGRDRRVTVPITCSRTTTCRGTFRLLERLPRGRTRLLAKTTVKLAARRDLKVRVRLSTKHARRLRGRVTKVRLVLVSGGLQAQRDVTLRG